MQRLRYDDAMLRVIEKIPAPLYGLSLGLAGLGRLSIVVGLELAGWVLGALSALLLFALLAKHIMHPRTFVVDMRNPVLAGSFGAGGMASFVLCGYFAPISIALGQIAWFVALLIHTALIGYYFFAVIFKADINNVTPVYFVVFMGPAAGALSASTLNMHLAGQIGLACSAACVAVLYVVIGLKYLRAQQVADGIRPLLCIFAAPWNMCLTCYFALGMPINGTLLAPYYAVGTGLLVFAVVNAVICMRKRTFYPSFASMTFPFVIAASASHCIANAGFGMLSSIASWLFAPEAVIAVIMVSYVTVRCILHLKR